MSILKKIVSQKSWRSLVKTLGEDCEILGPVGCCRLLVSQTCTILMKDLGFPRLRAEMSVKPRDLRYPLRFRICSSDPYTIRQVLVCREHDDLLGLPDVKFVVDCGANIGAASVRFLSQYPSCRLLAIEPDPQNFEILQRNLAPYGERATALCAAVWNRSDRILECSRGTYRDRLDWATTVQERPDGLGNTPTVSLEDVLKDSGFDRIDVLKIDIEGAEASVFDEQCHAWLAHTRHLCIELHGNDCAKAFDAALEDYSCERFERNELVICRSLTGAIAPAVL